MSNPSLTDALAGARYSAPVSNSKKTVLVAGAAGRLGERILTRLLGSSELNAVYVLAADVVPSTEAKLTAVTQAAWCHRVDHVIAVVSERIDDSLVIRRKRTEIFSALVVDDVLALARHAKSLGVTSFTLVTPHDVLSQPSAIYAQLSNMMESDLHQIGFDSLVLVRPSDHEIRRRTGSFAKRFFSTVIDTASGLMVGLRHTPLSLEDTARGIVRAMLDSAQGLNIIETDRLHALLRS